jgi:hypothetical protein
MIVKNKNKCRIEEQNYKNTEGTRMPVVAPNSSPDNPTQETPRT